MKYVNDKESDVMLELETSFDGISPEEAMKRQAQYGPNKLDEKEKETLAAKFLKQLADPMLIVLLGAAAVSGVISYLAKEFPSDVIIILLVVVLNCVLGVLQESKAEEAIDALQKISGATCKVVRSGKQSTMATTELVPGDVIILEAGDAVPADGRLIEAASLKIEEAALTGESVPVDKFTFAIKDENPPLGDRKNMVYMGSSVSYGRGRAIVTGTGMSTEMGKIATVLNTAEDGKTPLQKKLTELSKILTYLVLVICVVIFAVNMARSYMTAHVITVGNALDTFMIAVSLAVAAIPEGLATVVTIVLSMGVTKMSKRHAIVRKLSAVETLGCTNIICSDKTGTLTQNKMTVVEAFADDEELLARGMALCSDAIMDESDETKAANGGKALAIGEPTECALVTYAYIGKGQDTNKERETYARLGEVPFDSDRKMMTTIHQWGDGYLQFTKGGLDEILSHCTTILVNGEAVPLTEEHLAQIRIKNKEMADRALRVLALAKKERAEVPKECTTALEDDMTYVGITGMIDPVRPEVKDAIRRCKSAGIRPIMITGDHKDTAVAIAKELGIIEDASAALTGTELTAIPDEVFKDSITQYSVYARVQPEHKTRIVNAWQGKEMITAMTGDGVNDAPSIKSADIGIGMGITGTDVTKNVADVILTDDNFATIVDAVEEGRRIYDNIRRAIQFLLSSNMSEVLIVFFATLGGINIFKPAQLLWINLITDCLPALALGVEDAEEGIMERKPRDSKDSIFSDGLGKRIVIHAVYITIITLIAYYMGVKFFAPGSPYAAKTVGTTMAFITLSMTETFHSFNMRSLKHSIFKIKKQNMLLWGSAVLSTVLTVGVVEIAPLARAFSLASVGVPAMMTAVLLAVSIIVFVEIAKILMK